MDLSFCFLLRSNAFIIVLAGTLKFVPFFGDFTKRNVRFFSKKKAHVYLLLQREGDSNP